MTNLTPLVEDAARGWWSTHVARHPDPDSFLSFDELRDSSRKTISAEVTGALLAFHNPDSEAGKALVECVARGLAAWARPNDTLMEIDRDCARAALTAIATALKETALPTPGVQTK